MEGLLVGKEVGDGYGSTPECGVFPFQYALSSIETAIHNIIIKVNTPKNSLKYAKIRKDSANNMSNSITFIFINFQQIYNKY